jgi:integrase
MKAAAYAAELNMIDPATNVRIQDMRVMPKISLSSDESEFDGKYLTESDMQRLIDFYHSDNEPRRKEFIEMFLFAFHACGLRVVDIMTLQWNHVDLKKKELRKIMIKTSKRHVIPLTDAAIEILEKWKAKQNGRRFVFDLIDDSLDLDNDEALYKARNTATKCINQSLIVVGEKIDLQFNLTMHSARHSFAVFALNKGLSMSVVSRLLGHGSTDITEKVYARFLPETLSAELNKLKDDFSNFAI